MALTCASLAKLSEIKDLTEEDAKLVRRIWKLLSRNELLELVEKEPSGKFSKTVAWIEDCYHKPKSREIKMAAIDELIGTCGVEYLGIYGKRGNLQGHMVYCCNAGDTYAATITFIGTTLRIGCMGEFFDGALAKDGDE